MMAVPQRLHWRIVHGVVLQRLKQICDLSQQSLKGSTDDA